MRADALQAGWGKQAGPKGRAMLAEVDAMGSKGVSCRKGNGPGRNGRTFVLRGLGRGFLETSHLTMRNREAP